MRRPTTRAQQNREEDAAKRFETCRTRPRFPPGFPFCPCRSPLESWWRVHPQHPGLAAPGILPAMRRCTLEVETVARLEMVLLPFERNLQFSLQDVQKLF